MRKVNISINGRNYSVFGDRSEEDIKRIAGMVDERIQVIKATGQVHSPVDIAVLAALNMGEEFLDAEAKLAGGEERVLEATLEAEKLRTLLAQEKENTAHGQNSAAAMEDQMRAYEEEVERLKAKVGEYENNFFDLQMQNIKLKNDLDKLRGTQDSNI